jgi:hypothetical protein
LHDAGLMIGLYQEGQSSKTARDVASGRQPGAIKVGDSWYQILGFSPLGSLLAIGANLARDQEEEGLPGAGIQTAGQIVGEQPLAIGSKQILELLKGGNRAERFLGATAGSFIPSGASDLAEALDPQQRETKGDPLTGQFRKRVPGLRETLPEAFDVLGQPRQDLGPVQALLDPTRSTSDRTRENPLLGELVRLDLGISGFKQKKDEPSEQYQARVQRFGQLLQQYGLDLLSSRPYQQGSDATKFELLSRLIERAKRLITEGDEEDPSSRLSPQSLLESITRKKLQQHR